MEWFESYKAGLVEKISTIIVDTEFLDGGASRVTLTYGSIRVHTHKSLRSVVGRTGSLYLQGHHTTTFPERYNVFKYLDKLKYGKWSRPR